MSIFEDFDKKVDLKGLKEDVSEARKNGGSGNYKDVPDGTYEVAITKLEPKASRSGDPMLSVWFKILTGDLKGQLIFMNQLLREGFQIGIAEDFLDSLASGVEISFDSYKQFENLIMDVKENIDKDHLEYLLQYSHNDKGFPKYVIKEVYEEN